MCLLGRKSGVIDENVQFCYGHSLFLSFAVLAGSVFASSVFASSVLVSSVFAGSVFVSSVFVIRYFGQFCFCSSVFVFAVFVCTDIYTITFTKSKAGEFLRIVNDKKHEVY